MYEEKGTHIKNEQRKIILCEGFSCYSFFSHETLVVDSEQRSLEWEGEGGKKLRPMKNRFDSRKHSTQTLDRLYMAVACSYKQFVLATLHSVYPSYEKPFATQAIFLISSAAAAAHTNVQRVYSRKKGNNSSKEEKESK